MFVYYLENLKLKASLSSTVYVIDKFSLTYFKSVFTVLYDTCFTQLPKTIIFKIIIIAKQ